jgi:uncharacterized protein YggE
VALVAPGASRAQALPCNGTLLQLQVQQQGTASVDRFRFNLGLEAEAPTKAAALDQLNVRLAAVRKAVTPLALGKLTIPAPSTYRSGGGGGGAGPVREQASTSVSGEVSKANYNALIQVAGRLPGLTLRGFTAEAASGSAAQLQTRLLREALAEGQRQAQSTADALGLRRVQLLRIDQRGGGPIRPMPYAMAARNGFNPDEAREPESSVSLALDYCLF